LTSASSFWRNLKHIKKNPAAVPSKTISSKPRAKPCPQARPSATAGPDAAVAGGEPAASANPKAKARKPSRSRASPRAHSPAPARATTTEGLIARVERALERELARIEMILSESGAVAGDDGEQERRARTLASLARTLNEVIRLRDEDRKTKNVDHESMPRDLDEFRRELSQRLDRLVAEAETAHPESS
jgi:hypothetical protein